MYSIKLACLRTTEPLFRTYEPSDLTTFRTESYQCRCRTYEPSDSRTFGMKNLLFRTYEPSDYRTFGLVTVTHGSHRGITNVRKNICSVTVTPKSILSHIVLSYNPRHRASAYNKALSGMGCFVA